MKIERQFKLQTTELNSNFVCHLLEKKGQKYEKTLKFDVTGKNSKFRLNTVHSKSSPLWVKLLRRDFCLEMCLLKKSTQGNFDCILDFPMIETKSWLETWVA